MNGFLLTVDQALEFFRRCSELKEDTYENREKLMKEMVKERRAFPQSEAQINKRLAGKNVLKIKATKKGQ